MSSKFVATFLIVLLYSFGSKVIAQTQPAAKIKSGRQGPEDKCVVVVFYGAGKWSLLGQDRTKKRLSGSCKTG